MKMKIIITVEDGEVKDVKIDKTEDVTKAKSFSVYARCFDESNVNWSKDPEQNLFFLTQTQRYLSDMLKQRGFLFLNEAYEMLGLPKTKAGQIVGWVYKENNPIGDNRVDLGIYNTSNVAAVKGYENTVWLDFNVDGNIMDTLP